MDSRIFEIILSLIPVLGTIITAFIIPLIKEKIGTEKLAKYEYWASMAVKCAEMLWPDSGTGTDKKAYAVNILNNMFNKNKVIITEQQIEILVEACVNEMNARNNEDT